MSLTDTPPPSEAEQQPIAWQLRLVLGCFVLAFNGALIWYLVIVGKGDNALHTSALSWAFLLSTLILGGFGFGSLINPLLSAFGKK
jgi:hypothetical protein